MLMDAATLIHPQQKQPATPVAGPSIDAGRVRDIVLVRLATGGKTIARTDLAHDLWPIVAHLLPFAEWQTVLDRDLGALADAGLCDAKPIAVTITAPGTKRAALVLGVNALPRTWTEAKGARLIAKTLGMESATPRRLKTLLKPDGLRAEIVQHAFKLKLRGVPTPARLRSQLAKLAVTRAFGDSLPPGIDGRSGLSASAGRALAGRLAEPPRTFPTDSRLVAALAMEHSGAQKPSFEGLQTALLRRYVTRGAIKPAAPAKPARRTAKSAAVAPAKTATPAVAPLRLIETAAAPAAMTASRPDFAGFVAAIRALADGVAEGWPGNRKAFVSKVWTAVTARHPEWHISEIEFKAMLVEAHRVGRIVLSNADLKDQRSIADIQASAIAYKNAIFHFIRVDD
jgi:hypothetical protein